MTFQKKNQTSNADNVNVYLAVIFSQNSKNKYFLKCFEINPTISCLTKSILQLLVKTLIYKKLAHLALFIIVKS